MRGVEHWAREPESWAPYWNPFHKKQFLNISSSIILNVSLSSNVNYECQCVYEFIDESEWSKNMNKIRVATMTHFTELVEFIHIRKILPQI